MPAEICFKCKEIRHGVFLYGDDRICPQCYEKNEQALAAIRVEKQAVDQPSNETTAASSAAVAAAAGTKQSRPSRSTAKKGSVSSNEVSDQTAPRPSAASVSDNVRNLLINELLSYLQFYRDKGNSAGLHRIIHNFYTAGEISTAKTSLISAFKDKLLNCPFTVERRNSSVRQASDAEVEDILSMLEILDASDLLKTVTFVATNHDRLPRYGPEELNICSIIDKQCNMDAQLEGISRQFSDLNSRNDQIVSTLSSNYTELDRKLSVLIDNINKMAIKKQPSTAPPYPTTDSLHVTGINPPPGTPGIDRSRNIVIFGVKESSNKEVWHNKLFSILQIVLGKDSSNIVEDAYRLGKHHSSKTRPILIKLKSAWEKRLILSNSYCLSKFPEYKKSVFIRSDEPVESRRKAALKALHDRAQRKGKKAVIVDDILLINNEPVYSLQNGPIRSAAPISPNDDHVDSVPVSPAPETSNDILQGNSSINDTDDV